MARKPKKNKTQQPDMLGEDTPSDDLLRINMNAPAERLYEGRRLRGRALTWTFIVVGVGCIGLALNTFANPADPNAGVAPVDSVAVNSSLGKSLAHSSITTWLAGEPSPLPGGYIVSWDGFESIEGEESTSSSDNPANAAEIHRFTLATSLDDKAVFYDATVLVSVSDQLGAMVAGEPSLLPRVPAAAQGWSSELWPGYDSATISDSVTQSVTQWARSFTESADALRLYVGDEDASHAYMPLQGARVISTAVPNAGYIKVDGEDIPKAIIARVELTLSWSASGEKGAPVMYDVRIEQAHTASPKVVAWGPTGTGPTLVKYGNAIDNLKLSNTVTVPAPSIAPEDVTDETVQDETVQDEEGEN